MFAHLDVAPWQFFLASTLTFGGALVGITYGVLSASWEPGREGTFWGGAEIKVNVPILMATVLGKASGETASHTTPFAWCTSFLKDFSRRHSSPALPFQRTFDR